MRIKWNLALIAAQLNAFLITGAATRFRFSGIALFDPDLSGLLIVYHINTFLFALGMFVISMLVFIAFICIEGLVKGVTTKSVFRETKNVFRETKNDFISSPV